MFKPKTAMLASTALAIGALGAGAPLAQAGIKVPDRHPDGIRVPDATRHIIGVLRHHSVRFEPNASRSFEPNAYPPGPGGS